MAPKRKNDQRDEPNARERKKIKVAHARTISVQAASGSASASDQGNAAASASAGPSKTVVQFDSMQGLPASIDVERFTEARAYEIDAMQKAIKSASDSSTHRVWQTLPRHLRRRAASHDVRRVPVRLREKAWAEMDANRRRLLGRPKRGKMNQITRTQSFLKRQRDKSWLETHIWHAKRARMQTIWGYRLAVTPTEKAFRPSHRASMHGSILHDASYYATIELKGPQLLLRTTLEQCCDPQFSGMKRCMTGSRAFETHLYKRASYPFGLLGPVTIIWRPCSSDTDPTQTQEPITQSGKDKGMSKKKEKGREKQADDNPSLETVSSPRVAWVRCHPAMFQDVFETLQTSASYILAQSKKMHPQVQTEIEIADLRGCINTFEIMGPKSSQVIRGALTLAGNEDRKDVKKFWDSLTELQTSASIPRGMVIGLKVLDPRLKFPPKNAKPHYSDVTQPSMQSSPAFIFPTALTAQSEIWDEDVRGSLQKPRYKKKDLDERRSKNLVPGTSLNPLRQDDRIPVLLVQRSIEPCPSTSTSHSNRSQGIHGWTLFFPAGWSMAFLSSLLHTGTRFAGQRERTKQFFEAGVGGFPGDYPTTGAYDVAIEERAEQERAKWERTPKAKKANYDKLGTRSAWVPDWEVVLGLEGAKGGRARSEGSGGGGRGRGSGGEELVTTQREPEVDAQGPVVQPWLLRGPRVVDMLFDAFITPVQFLGEVNKLREKQHAGPLETEMSAEELVRAALVMVRARMVGRGAPTDMANMYKMDDGEARRWIRAFGKGVEGEGSSENEYELGEIKPSQTDIVGYVTTGDVSLTRGEGFAIGAIPVVRYLALRKQALRLDQSALLVKIRDRDGTTCRAAYLELLDA